MSSRALLQEAPGIDSFALQQDAHGALSTLMKNTWHFAQRLSGHRVSSVVSCAQQDCVFSFQLPLCLP